jgi:hypothetical protein
MSNIDIQRSNGDFRVDAAGNITLATNYLGGGAGLYNGNITVLGNLVVIGNSTTIQSTNLTTTDRIVTLNKGETGPGVLLSVAGIQIDRGSTVNPGTGLLQSRGIDATWFWDETQIWTYNNVSNTGMWTAKVGTSQAGIVTNAIRTLGSANLSLLGAENPGAVVTVEGTTNYYLNVTNNNHIPNKQYVDNAIGAQPDRARLQISYQTSPGTYHTDSTSQVLVLDSTTPNVSPSATEPQIRFQVNNQQWITMYNNRLDIGQLRFSTPNTLTTNASGVNIILSTVANSGSVIKPDVQITAPLRLDIDANYSSSNPATASGSIKLYAQTEGAGGTGVFFVNSQNTRDEIPSKRRSFVAALVL